jgi:glucose/arabinose dehydrogenase
MDGVQRQGVDVHNDNPAEELNYHGVLDDITDTNPLEGANYGYPSCLAVWNSSTLRNENLTVGSQFYANIPEGQDIVAADATCANFTLPQVVFPAHNAPLDIKFNANGSSAFISFHGSW